MIAILKLRDVKLDLSNVTIKADEKMICGDFKVDIPNWDEVKINAKDKNLLELVYKPEDSTDTVSELSQPDDNNGELLSDSCYIGTLVGCGEMTSASDEAREEANETLAPRVERWNKRLAQTPQVGVPGEDLEPRCGSMEATQKL